MPFQKSGHPFVLSKKHSVRFLISSIFYYFLSYYKLKYEITQTKGFPPDLHDSVYLRILAGQAPLPRFRGSSARPAAYIEAP